MDNSAETSLALNDDVRDTHLTAKSRKEDDQFDRVNIISNDDERRLLCLDERDAVVETVFDEMRLLLRLLLFLLRGSLSSSSETGFLLLLGLRAVLVKQLEELRRSVLVESVGELRNRRRDL